MEKVKDETLQCTARAFVEVGGHRCDVKHVCLCKSW